MKMTKENFMEYFISNIYGGGIMTVKTYKGNVSLPQHSSHLHFLFSFDQETDVMYVICLDSGAITRVYNYSRKTFSATIKAMGLLSNCFIESIHTRGKIKASFKKRLWDEFCNLKQNSFVNGLKSLKEGVSFEKIFTFLMKMYIISN